MALRYIWQARARAPCTSAPGARNAKQDLLRRLGKVVASDTKSNQEESQAPRSRGNLSRCSEMGTISPFRPQIGNFRNHSRFGSRPRAVARDDIRLLTSRRCEDILSKGQRLLLQCRGEYRNETRLLLQSKSSIRVNASNEDHLTLKPSNTIFGGERRKAIICVSKIRASSFRNQESVRRTCPRRGA